MPYPLDIGTQLIAARTSSGLTQRELGRRLGVKQPQIARWESTKYRSASLAHVDAVARALGLETATPLPAAETAAVYAAQSADTAERALARLGVRPETIEAFCRLHGIAEFALFGSSVRTDFSPESDVDILLTWSEGAAPADFQTLLDIEAELSGIFRREVDVVDRAAVERSENYVRARRILDGARSVYVAR